MGYYIQTEFVECDECRIKPGSPLLCSDCLERRNEHVKRGECRSPKVCTPEVRARARAFDDYQNENNEYNDYWESINYNE